ncbi:polysaccharide deacetylase family protein [Desulfothermus okinawensis JCM 13304]
MWFLKFFGYHVISINDLLKIIENGRYVKKRMVVLTFDDGYANFYRYAYPILNKYNFPSIVYLLSNLIGKRAIWFKREGRDDPPLLTREQVVILKNRGVDFGSHGRNHVKLAKVSHEVAREEIVRSKIELEHMFGFPFQHFCYPYGSLNQDVKELVKQAGYKTGVSCYRGAVYPGVDPFEIPRKAISFGDNLIGFLWKLEFKNRLKKREAA